uniref:ATP synthase F0 subunit 8 n=1 Tax=Purohita sinica TaxID=871393 RepID=A0A7S5DCK0_9HEMI|nr:ATP synthase F0 subunit 8 [Purohita sinica]
MPQMAPCPWMMILILSTFMMLTMKMNIYFEKKS